MADLAKNNNMKIQAQRDEVHQGRGGERRSRAEERPEAGDVSAAASFTVADFARWLEALPAGASRQIGNTPDSLLTPFLEGLTQNVLVIRDMDSAKVQVPPANWQALQLAYRATIDQLAAAIGLADSAVSDTDQAEGRAARLRRLAGQSLHGPAARGPGAVPSAAAAARGAPA